MLKKIFGVLSLVLAYGIAIQAQQPSVTIIRTGKLLDVDAGRALLNQTIVIRGGKIESVGENLAAPAGATVIDLSKMTVLPGLIDCHTHLADGAREGNDDPISQLRRTATRRTCWANPNCSAR